MDFSFSINSSFALISLWFVSLLTITKFIRKITTIADEELNIKKKEKLSNHLLYLTKKTPDDSWLNYFNFLFDVIFGENHFSIKCFLISTSISLTTYFFLSLGTYLTTYCFGLSITSFLIFAFLINVIIDYISLLQTRIVLSLNISIIFKLLIDIILTVLITLVWISCIYAIYLNSIGYFELSYFNFQGILIDIYNNFINFSKSLFRIHEESNKEDLCSSGLQSQNLQITIFVLTSFTTSIWLWLHGLSHLIIRYLHFTKWISDWLNIEKAPIRSIGIFCNILIIILFILALPLILIIQ
jgi:hypothetical protein